MPLTIIFLMYDLSIWPVHPDIIGYFISLSYKNYLILFVASFPSIIGIWKSIRIRSKLQNLKSFSCTFFIIIFSAYNPFTASVQISLWFSTPTICKIIWSEYLLNSSSSTIKILFFFKLRFYLNSISLSLINWFNC